MESSFQPPVRKSLSDEELAARVNLATSSHSGIEAVMELLVAQEALRAQEDAEIASWVAQMESDGSLEAHTALSNYRRSVQGSTPVAQTYEEPVTDANPIQAYDEVISEAEQKPDEEHAIAEESTSTVTSTDNPFSWFIRTQSPPRESVPEDVVVEPVIEEPVVEETVVEDPVVEETVVEDVLVSVVDEEGLSVEEVALIASDLHPEGSETADAFDQLLAAASAEEELTALEDSRQNHVSSRDTSTNVAIPSDENRDRKPISQLFSWLGASATVVPMILVFTLIHLGLSASAIAVDLVVGYLVAGTLIGVASLAGKRSGLSTAMISRAVFGVWGNSIPLSILFASRALVTALFLGTLTYLLDGVAVPLSSFDEIAATFAGINITTGFIVQLLVLSGVAALSFVRGSASRLVQVFVSILAFVLVAESFSGLPLGNFTMVALGQVGILSKESLVGIALVVMVAVTLWVAIAPNLSKAIPMKPRGSKVFGFVLLSNSVAPVVVGLVTLMWLGSASAGISETIAQMPNWSRGALTYGVGLSVVFATLLNLKTASLDFLALFRMRSKILGIILSSLAVVGLLLLFAQQPVSQKLEYLVNLFVLVAALSAGWIGLFIADVALRKIAYHELSLSRSYGFYKKFNLISISIWLVTLGSAVAFIPVNLLGFSYFGFGLPSIGLAGDLLAAPLGFAITVLLGIVLTIAVRIPQIRKQEREVLAVESRREQLNDIFVGQE